MPGPDILGEDAKKILKESLRILKEKVVLEVFTRSGQNDQYNAVTVALTKELPALSDRIIVNFNTIGEDKSKRYNITRSPTVLISPDSYSIRYSGAPVGEEGRSLIQTIMRVSLRESGLSEKSREKLAALKDRRNIQVFVTLTCPYCPGEVLNAFACAIERPDLIVAECIDAQENMDLVRKFGVGGVPHTAVNGITVGKGLTQEERFIDRLISLKEFVEIKNAPAGEKEDRLEVDVVIVGGGPAGLTAAIYAQRSGLKTVVLEKAVLGGQVAVTPVVENWPGFARIPGAKLMELIGAHAREYTEIHESETVREIKIGKKIEVLTPIRKYVARAVILAMGARHRKLGVQGEDRLSGRGVAYCATCDGFLYKGKKVAVIGGGNAALTDALYLHSLGAELIVIHRKDSFRAEKRLMDTLAATGTPVLWDTVVEEIYGTEAVSGLKLKNVRTGETKDFLLDGVFISVGEEPESDLAREIGVLVNEQNFIKVDRDMRTNIPRVYAAGDITGGVRQIVTAVGAGAVAALSAFEDLADPYWKKKMA